MSAEDDDVQTSYEIIAVAGTLNVWLRTSGSNQVLIWTQSGDQGDVWNFGRVPFISTGSSYQLIIQGVCGNGYTGDIAIDDIYFTSSGCSIQPPVATPAPLTSASPVTQLTTRSGTYPPTQWDCNFESSFCTWTQATDDEFDWTRQQGSTVSVDTGPAYDHTTGTAQGWYTYIETSSPRAADDKARLESTAVPAGSVRCLRFWYHMYGAHIETLNVYVKTSSGLGSAVWTRGGGIDDLWHFAEVTVTAAQTYQVVFEGVRGTDYQGDIALDDLTLIDGQCSYISGLTCDFESDQCGLTNDGLDTFDWLRTQGSTITPGTGPSVDHTLGTALGYYMYADVTNQAVGSYARLTTPNHVQISGSCLNFWYHMYGPDVGYLTVYLNSTLGEQVIWKKWFDQGDQWFLGQASVSSTEQFMLGIILPGFTSYLTQIVFEASHQVSSGDQGDIAIDDIILDTSGACPEPGDCTFDSDTCTWTNIQGDDFDWVRQTGSTVSVGTGPSSDHTSGKGYYMYIETSSPRTQGETAVFVSEEFPPTDSQGLCMHFWYHMYGSTMGKFNIYIDTGTLSNPNRMLLWQLGSDQGNYWNSGQVPVDSVSSPYRMVFEGVVGSSYYGDVAIDDVSFTVGTCSLQPVSAIPVPGSTTVVPTTLSVQTSPNYPPSYWDCDFEQGLCSWTQAQDDDFEWVRAQGPTGTSNTGPVYDHTTGTDQGWYVYIEANNKDEDDAARLESSVIPATSQSCLVFYYHMYGTHVNTLSVYIKTNGQLGSPVWTRSGADENDWMYAQYWITSTTSYQIVFEGTAGSGVRGDIALDDIVLFDGECPTPPYHSLECDFEDNHLCDWTQESDDDFDWTWGSGSTVTPGTGPSVDHTTGTDQGHYLYVDAALQTLGDKARVKTGLYQWPDDSAVKCVNFYYHFYGDHIGTFGIYKDLMANGQTSRVFIGQITGLTLGDNWVLAQVPIYSFESSNVSIVFEATVGNGIQGDMAIDDLFILDGACPTRGSTDFENGMGMWYNVHDNQVDDFDWIIGSGRSNVAFTGPATDHTLGTIDGHYGFIDVSGGSKGALARLQSVPLSNINRCVMFWYHMFGDEIGQLKVYMKSEVTQAELFLWKLVGEQNDQDTWMYGQVPFAAMGDPYTIIFEGVEGSGDLGDIAIDDIVILDNQLCELMPDYADPTINPSTAVSCDFENDICGWIQEAEDDFDWSRKVGSTSTLYTGPQFDHTTGTGFLESQKQIFTQNFEMFIEFTGYYIYIETSTPNFEGDKALLVTEGLPATGPSGNCFSFWYHMYGIDVESLDVYIKLVGQSSRSLIYRREGSYGNEWRYAQRTIQSEFDFRIILEAVVGESVYGDVALDDISYSVGPCSVIPGYCDFEADMCEWTTGTTGNFEWTRQSNSSSLLGINNDGPLFDHSTESGTGYYVFSSMSAPRVRGDTSSLVSATYPGSASGDCVEFWYHMHSSANTGRGSGTLTLSYQSTGSPTVLWSTSGERGDLWRYEAVSVNSLYNYQIIFGATVDQVGSADISLDDIRITTGQQCPPAGFCDFEDGFCSWTNPKPVEGMDDFNWARGQGGTATGYTGPSFDHTKGNDLGYFLFFESSKTTTGETAWLMSEYFNPTVDSCLTFWYHMYGDTIGALNIYIYSGSTPILLWSKSGNQGDVWRQGQVSVYSSVEYQVVFEGVRGSSNTGDIAIDDVNYQNSICSGVTTLSPTTTATTALAVIYDCDFEVDYCTWTQDPNNDLDWLRNKGDTPSDDSGPTFDHTTGTDQGYYIYIEATNQDPGDKARLISAQVPSMSGERCLQFWYHMYGSSVGELNVYVRNINGEDIMIWRRTGSQANEWRYAQRELNITTSYVIIFEAVRATHYRSDIALDDIKVTSGSCPAQG
ncbi:MAM and LDL-receptor class A domain-containing protein 2-like [Ptychodera flava]|uniref:MAM and LDL-receptor class A domain-containing protein 2-like n=1 Tax=Ptychodera flava TaxID=63121 RepID=UPI003969C967